jgi:beta-lactamase regulating signal transducer with metallopeptidase domain
MTAPDILALLLAANIAGSVGILLVIALRPAARQWIGARAAYGLWLIPLVAALAAMLPARSADVIPVASAPIRPVAFTMIDAAGEWAAPIGATATGPVAFDPALLLVLVWLTGMIAVLVVTLVRQHRSMAAFGAMTREGDILRAGSAAGPAVVGLIRPRIVTPADFEARFSERERELVLTHERAHLRAGDTRINAVLALLTCLNWFNPLAHIAARLARVDQELACDAAVVERYPGERRIYAEALLKTQLTPASLPLGCTWPPQTYNLLRERVTMLANRTPARATRLAGAILIAAAGLGAGLAAWAAQPPDAAPVFIPDRTAESMLLPRESFERSPLPPSELTPEYRNISGALRASAIGMMDPDSPRVRNIPERQIVEASLFVRLPGGDVLGPHRILSSLPLDITTAEFAKDPRFSAGMLAHVETDGSLRLGFGLSIEEQPLRVWGLRMKSGETAVVELAGGYIVNVTALLRPMNELELRRARQWTTKAVPLTQPDTQGVPPPAKAQEADQPNLQPPPAPAASVPDDVVITCNAWNGRHSIDPKVDWDNVDKNAPVVLTFKGRQGRVTLPNSAFPVGAYPTSVANAEKGLSLRTGDRFVYQSISPAVIDTITFDGLETGNLRAVWQRFRIDADKPRAIALQGRCTRS